MVHVLSQMSDGAFYVCIGGSVLLVVAVLAGIVWSVPIRCTLCDLPLRRTRHTWKVLEAGKKRTLHPCPNCNSTFERRQSKPATDKFFGRR